MTDGIPPVPADDGVLLFSYGTLQQPDVQLATFGRHLDGEHDAVVGHELGWVAIVDPHVIATSGSDRHPVLVASDHADSAVDGTVFAITAAELAAADDYEVDDYTRVLVPLRSGRQAWVYALAAGEKGERPSCSRGSPTTVRSRPPTCATGSASPNDPPTSC